jgi:hypothetical protein
MLRIDGQALVEAGHRPQENTGSVCRKRLSSKHLGCTLFSGPADQGEDFFRGTRCTMNYDFTLELTGIEDIRDDAADRLYESGCDDALLGQRSGRVYLSFAREAPSLREAIRSAVEDVNAAGFGVLRVESE